MEFLYKLPALLIAITIHEYSHGLTAYKLGDPTPKHAGRLTLNPLAHLDPVGAFMLFIFRFGWAKPVPINPLYFSNRKIGIFLVSIAGPLSNLLISILSIIILRFITPGSVIYNLLILIYWFNLSLCIFNLIPLSPLDGSHILYSLLPQKYYLYLQQFDQIGQIILFILLITGVIGHILNPILNMVNNVILHLFK